MKLTPQKLDALWDSQETHRDDLKTRYKYYDGEHAIVGRNAKFASGDKKSEVVTNFAQYIIDLYVGSLTSTDYQLVQRDENGSKVDDYRTAVDDMQLDAADVQNLANALIFGYALELHEYVDGKHVVKPEKPYRWALSRDEDGNIALAVNRFVLPKYSVYEGELLDNDMEFQYSYDATRVLVHKRERRDGNIKAKWEEVESRDHFFGAVPVAELYVDDDRCGLLCKPLRDQMDEYNDIDSLSGDDIRQTADALLKIKGVSPRFVQDNADMIRNLRILPLAEDAEAEYLQKNTDVARYESKLMRAREAIHTMASVPDVQQIVGVTGGTSGIALQLKFMPMQNRATAMTKQIAKGIRARIDLMNAIARKVGNNVLDDYKVVIGFSMPINRIEEWQNIGALDGIVTHRTQLELLTDIDDPEGELDRLQSEGDRRAETEAINQNPDAVAAQQDVAVQQAASLITPRLESALDAMSDKLISLVARQG